MFSVLFCSPPPPTKVVNKSKVRRAGSGNLESRKYGIPFPSFDYAQFSLHFLLNSLHIQWSLEKKSQPELSPSSLSPHKSSIQLHFGCAHLFNFFCTRVGFLLSLYFTVLNHISIVKCHVVTKGSSMSFNGCIIFFPRGRVKFNYIPYRLHCID